MSKIHPEQAVARDQVGRAVGIVGLLGIALIHILDALGKFSETPYIFWLYAILMAGTVLVSMVLLRTDSRLAWALTALAAGVTLLAFILSRTTGLPNATDDIGNWSEPLGVASLFVEGAVLVLAVYKLLTTPAVQVGETRHVVDAMSGRSMPPRANGSRPAEPLERRDERGVRESSAQDGSG
jgi:hypothetical protein